MAVRVSVDEPNRNVASFRADEIAKNVSSQLQSNLTSFIHTQHSINDFYTSLKKKKYLTGIKMVGSFLARLLLLGLGYVYPAYECYKTIENNDISIDQLKFWCQYWILVALLTVFESVGDNFLSWLPLYGEAKFALVLFLWHPKTRGTAYVYSSFVRLYLANHEKEIDINLQKIRNKVENITTLALQKFIIYGQSRFLEVVQYVTSQSALRLQTS